MESRRKNTGNLTDKDKNWVRKDAAKLSIYQLFKRRRIDATLSLDVSGSPDEMARVRYLYSTYPLSPD